MSENPFRPRPNPTSNQTPKDATYLRDQANNFDGVRWCSWDNFWLRIRKFSDVRTVLTLFNPNGAELEEIWLDPGATPWRRPIPYEVAHCLINFVATDSDKAFYGNPHALLESGEILELPSGLKLQRMNILYCYLISGKKDRSDFILF